MKINKPIRFLLMFFLLSDLAFSFVQYYQTPLYGDTDSHILPDQNIQKVLDDPFGFKVLLRGEKHPNPNRFFYHYFYKEYFQKAPLFFQNFITPISSVYLSAALIKILIQILFLFLLASFISRKRSTLSTDFLLVAALISPLFQAYGYWSRLGINDQSIAYTFAYALPLVVLMAFLKPVFENLLYSKKITRTSYLILFLLIIILPLSGPLIPAISGIIILLISIKFIFPVKSKRLAEILTCIPTWYYWLLIPLAFLCIYSIYLGFFNSQDQGDSISLLQRYTKLPYGIWKHLFHSLGLPLLLILISLNFFLLRKHKDNETNQLKNTLKWIGAFTLIYILFLPFGGYRTYRPLIIRYDTIMPVTVAIIYLFGASSFYLLKNMQGKSRTKYIALLLTCLILYTVVDIKGLNKNKCERMAFEEMANSDKKVIKLPKDCFIMNWDNIHDYEKSKRRAELIHFWNITNEEKLFYNEK